MVSQRSGRRLLVEQLKPKHRPRKTPDQQFLREARLANLPRQLTLDLAQKPAFPRSAFDAVAQNPAPKHIRKKYVAHPFARLSLASTRCLIEHAAGRFAGCRKKDRGRWKEEAEPEDQTASPALCPRARRPFPIPKLAAQTLRTSGPLLRNAQPRGSQRARGDQRAFGLCPPMTNP